MELGVCAVLDQVPAYNGPCLQAFSLARSLRDRGINTFFVGSSPVDPNFAPCVRGAVLAEYLPPAASIYKPAAEVYRNGGCWKYYAELFWKLRHKYQLVHIHGMPDNIYSYFPLFKALGKKVIVKMTGLGINDPLAIGGGDGGWWKLPAVSLADRFVATSQALADAYCKSRLSPQKLIRIHNGVDTERFRPVSPGKKKRLKIELELNPGFKTVIYVGTLQKSKGLDLLISAWEKVVTEYPEAELALVGPLCSLCIKSQMREPEFIKSINSKIGLHKMGKNWVRLGRRKTHIQLMGPKEDVYRYLQASDIFVFPSRSEGLPNALLEAMACGLPSIAVDIPPVRQDIITRPGEEGLIVPPQTEEIAHSIIKLLKDEKLAQNIGSQGRKRVGGHFSLAETARQYEELYNELVKSN